MPRASFVIPAYNAEAWLAQSILSCRGQSIKEVEIIVVNDGSTDGTRELINWHVEQDPRVKGIHLDSNFGRSHARNVGNAIALAPIILVLDADDISLKNRVRDTICAFELKKADVVYGPFQIIDEMGNVIDAAAAGPFNKELSISRKLNFIGHSTMAYTKDVAAKIQYDENEFSELGLDDWKFQWDCFLNGFKMSCTKNYLSQYRWTQGNTEATRDQEKVDKLKDEYITYVTEKLSASI